MTLKSHLFQTNVKITLINTTSIYQIRGSLEQINYTGLCDAICLFGGLVIGEYSNEIYDEFFTVCDSTGLKIRNFYSQESSLILLLYWYKEYSKINISVILSQTTCMSVLFDPCLFSRECYLDTNLYLNNSDCAVIQIATHDIVLPILLSFSEHECFVNFVSTALGTTITEIAGIFNKVPFTAPKYHTEKFMIKKVDLCEQSSMKSCVKDNLGFSVPRIIQSVHVNSNYITTFKIDIHPSNHEFITDASLQFRRFTKSWLNIVLEKVSTDAKIQFNQIGRILDTVNPNFLLPFSGKLTVHKCLVTLQVINLSHPYVDDTYLSVTFYQKIVFIQYQIY